MTNELSGATVFNCYPHKCTWFNTKVICSSNTKGQKAHRCILKELFRISFWGSCTTIYSVLSWAKIILLRMVGKIDFESASLTSPGSPQSFIRVAFPILSAEHNMFVCDLFWKWDPFVLTDACSGAAAKAQLDFLDCHARLVIYPLLSHKPNYLFVTLENNYLPQRYTMLNSFSLGQDNNVAVGQGVGGNGNLKCRAVILISLDWNIWKV